MAEFDLAPALRWEAVISGNEVEAIWTRWEYGRWLLGQRAGKQLPEGLLDALTEATGKSRQELQFRVQFAERYPTEEQVSNALDTYGSWYEIVKSGLRDPRPPAEPQLPPSGSYSTIVVDPPWPIEKIERDVRPNQKAPLDYPVMSEDELRGLELPAASDAHLYLWTTHRFLPLALELVDLWDFRYQCVLTWVKNVGITPFSWMYSTELVVFARRGSLDLLIKGRRLDFKAKVRGHSRKPDEFYELVRDVSPAPRIDMFSRGPHEGFDAWGDEA